MIVNHTINKVINSTEENTESLLDLTADSVSPENLLLNKTAHNSEGEGIVGEMPEGGASDYDELENRPQINGNLLTGNKTGGQLGLQNRVLASTLNIGGQTIGNVEGALSALNESKSDLVNGKVPVNELPVYQPVIGSIQSIGGIVPPSSSGDEDKYLRSDGTWAKPSGGGGGVSDYDDLTNRPKINRTTLSGDKTGTQLGLQNIVLSSTMTIGGQTVTKVEEALRALNEKGGGHTILDEDGNTYPQRSKLQFEGCEITDDAVNDTTIVKCEGGGTVIVEVPTVTNTELIYDGTTKSPTITRDTAHTTITGTTEATEFGSYSFTISLSNPSYMWSDNTVAPKTYTWGVGYDGSTITPIDDIQTWLKCAGILDKSYTTLAEVLADSTTLAALMLSHNAVDYLVRSKSWATAKGLVPTMTSNTTPSGEASASSVYLNDSSFAAYKAFDNSDTGWIGDGVNNLWIRYQFETPVLCKNVKWKNRTWKDASAIKSPKNYKIQGSNDGSTWVDLGTFINNDNSSGATHECDISSNNNSYLYLQMAIIDCNSGNYNYCCVSSLQFYAYTNPVSEGICDNATAMTDIGADDYASDTLLADATWRQAICDSQYFESVLNVKVPTMTSNTTPSGQVLYETGAHPSASLAPWHAFDGNTSTGGHTATTGTTSTSEWIGYSFPNAVKIYKAYYLCDSSSGRYMTKAEVQGSNNGTNWNNLYTFSNPSTGANEGEFLPDAAYSKYRVKGTWTLTSSSYSAYILEMQFYGRS